MRAADERRIRDRLARVEALERGATTEGERSAAAAARQRVLARLARIRAADPVAAFVAAHLGSLGVPGDVPEPPAHLPDEAEIARVLRQWKAGDLDRHDVEAWAEAISDRVVLPTEADHPLACIGEVLLQLAMLHRVALDVRDVPAILSFLEDRDWRTWFAVLERAARRGWPIG